MISKKFRGKNTFHVRQQLKATSSRHTPVTTMKKKSLSFAFRAGYSYIQHSKMASNRSGKIEELWPKLIEKKLVTALKIWKWDRALVIMGEKNAINI
jgi:hypothetical protein